MRDGDGERDGMRTSLLWSCEISHTVVLVMQPNTYVRLPTAVRVSTCDVNTRLVARGNALVGFDIVYCVCLD